MLAVVGLLGLRAFSSIFLTEWLNWYSKSYGGIGIVMAIFFWIALLTAILLASASLSPAYAIRLEARTKAQASAAQSAPAGTQHG